MAKSTETRDEQAQTKVHYGTSPTSCKQVQPHLRTTDSIGNRHIWQIGIHPYNNEPWNCQMRRGTTLSVFYVQWIILIVVTAAKQIVRVIFQRFDVRLAVYMWICVHFCLILCSICSFVLLVRSLVCFFVFFAAARWRLPSEKSTVTPCCILVVVYFWAQVNSVHVLLWTKT